MWTDFSSASLSSFPPRRRQVLSKLSLSVFLKMRSNVFAFALNFMALLAVAFAVVVNTTELSGGASKDVFVPKIYVPTQGTVWTPGSQQVVEW